MYGRIVTTKKNVEEGFREGSYAEGLENILAFAWGMKAAKSEARQAISIVKTELQNFPNKKYK
jgi:hypothetical protein